MNIMRADACRYMALHAFGGIYADLDVSLKRPFPQCSGLCVGYEYSGNNPTLANFAMSATRENGCLMRAVSLCCQRLKSVKMNFTEDPHLVHNSCGPHTLTEAASGCADIMSHTELTTHVHHHIASNHWKTGYPSWIVERMKRAKWSHVYQH